MPGSGRLTLADWEEITLGLPAGDLFTAIAARLGKAVSTVSRMAVGPGRTGQQVRFWIDTVTVHLSIDGWRIRTVPSRLTAVDITRLRRPVPALQDRPQPDPAPGALAATSCVEVQRLVNSSGIITLGGQVMHVLTQDGVLWRTLPCPVPPGVPHTLQGVWLARPQSLPPARLVIQRKVSSRGAIRVALPHARQVVTVELGDATLRVTDSMEIWWIGADGSIQNAFWYG